MKIAEIRALSTDELLGRLEDSREELMNLRFQTVMGGLTDFTRLRFTRRTIARMLTVLQERENAEYQEGEK
ncbi:MAG TPA: 50S ribosomal protein L29 [Anaerolineales bacterium]|nr:50S ribosomal protein L29 [Anaerolineales bacterium]